MALVTDMPIITPDELKALRAALGLTQQEFRDRYGVPLPALRNWEQGRRVPDPVANLFLHMIRDDPERVAAMVRRWA